MGLAIHLLGFSNLELGSWNADCGRTEQFLWLPEIFNLQSTIINHLVHFFVP